MRNASRLSEESSIVVTSRGAARHRLRSSPISDRSAGAYATCSQAPQGGRATELSQPLAGHARRSLATAGRIAPFGLRRVRRAPCARARCTSMTGASLIPARLSAANHDVENGFLGEFGSTVQRCECQLFILRDWATRRGRVPPAPWGRSLAEILLRNWAQMIATFLLRTIVGCRGGRREPPSRGPGAALPTAPGRALPVALLGLSHEFSRIGLCGWAVRFPGVANQLDCSHAPTVSNARRR